MEGLQIVAAVSGPMKWGQILPGWHKWHKSHCRLRSAVMSVSSNVVESWKLKAYQCIMIDYQCHLLARRAGL